MKKFISIGEIMQRLTVPNYERLEQATTLHVTYGGSEANVAMTLARFGHDVTFATKVPHHALGQAVLAHLKAQGVNTNHVLQDGDCLGTYYLEMGYSIRPSQVIYHRKHSAFATVSTHEFDIDSLLNEKNMLHVSGITLALGEEVRKFTIELVKTAFQRGLIISFDFNYRKTLWSIDEAKDAIKDILPYVHVCFASLFDLEVLGCFGDNLDHENELLSTKRSRVFERYMRSSHCQYIFGTERTQTSVHRNQLKAYCYTANGEMYETSSYEVEIIDRVGAGDAFAAGVLHLLDFSQHNYAVACEFGLACGMLQHTIHGDVLCASVEEVNKWWHSNGQNQIMR